MVLIDQKLQIQAFDLSIKDTELFYLYSKFMFSLENDQLN